MHLAQYGFYHLFLIGSRATGKSRANSDHDFVALVEDSAPQEICTGGSLHAKLLRALYQQQTGTGLGNIDLLVMRRTHFANTSGVAGNFAFAAATQGFTVAS
jgi:hypothetical protein